MLQDVVRVFNFLCFAAWCCDGHLFGNLSLKEEADGSQ